MFSHNWSLKHIPVMSVPGGCAIGTPPSNIPPPGAAIFGNASLSVVNLTLVSLQCVKKGIQFGPVEFILKIMSL